MQVSPSSGVSIRAYCNGQLEYYLAFLRTANPIAVEVALHCRRDCDMRLLGESGPINGLSCQVKVGGSCVAFKRSQCLFSVRAQYR